MKPRVIYHDRCAQRYISGKNSSESVSITGLVVEIADFVKLEGNTDLIRQEMKYT